MTKLGFEDEWIVAEFEPLEDCVPTQPVQVKVKRILFGNLHDSDTFWFCDHYTESPEKMEAGKHIFPSCTDAEHARGISQ